MYNKVKGTERICKDCGDKHPLDEYKVKTKSRKQGFTYRTLCKKCITIYKRKYQKPVKYYGQEAYNKLLIASRKQSRKERDNLTDHFVLKCLKLNKSQATPELITLKRKQLCLARKLKQTQSQIS